MKASCYWPVALLPITSLVLTIAPPIQALNASEIKSIARAVTVQINSQTPGSGVIIQRQGNLYTVLTAQHVVQTDDEYTVTTADGKIYPIPPNNIKRFPPHIDLALLRFTSPHTYQVAEIGDSTKAVDGTPSFVAGFPFAKDGTSSTYRFTVSWITANTAHLLDKGYSLGYGNNTYVGMSGGPVLNAQGKLIGIHGQSITEFMDTLGIDPRFGRKIGINLAISSHTFLSYLPQVEVDLGLPTQPSRVRPVSKAADDLYIKAGLQWLENQDKDAFVATLTQAIQLNPRYAAAYLQRGIIRYYLEDYRGAIGDFDQTVAINPQMAEAYNGRGFVRVFQKDYPSAVKDFNQAIALNPQLDDAYLNRGAARFFQGDQQGAITDLNQAITLNPKLSEAYRNRGIIRFSQGDYSAAIQDFDQAIALNPQLDMAYLNRGMAYFRQGRQQNAVRNFNQAIALNPKLSEAYRHRGVIHSQRGDYPSAIKDFDQAIALNPKLAEAYLNRGFARSEQGNQQGAISDLDQAIALNPKLAEAYLNRGVAHSRQGDRRAAIRDFDQAIALNPHLALAFSNRGVNRLAIGDRQGALLDLTTAADLFKQQGSLKLHQDALKLIQQLQ